MYTREGAKKEIEKFKTLFIEGKYKERDKDKLHPSLESLSLNVVVDLYPDMMKEVVPVLLEATRKTGFYFYFPNAPKDVDDANELLKIYKQEIASPDNTPEALYSLYNSVHSITEKHPACADAAFEIFKDGLKSEKNNGHALETLYLYLSPSIIHKPDLAKDPELVDLIGKRLLAGQDNDRSLGFCYMLLDDVVKHNPAAAEKVIETFSLGLKSPNNDSWAIPRAYSSLKGILTQRSDLGEKIVSCAANIPTYKVREDNPHAEYFHKDVVSDCGLLFYTIVQTCPNLAKQAFDIMQNELQYVARLGNGNESYILKYINEHLDKDSKPAKGIGAILNGMLINDLKDGKNPFLQGNFEGAILKLPPQQAGDVLEGIFAGIKQANPDVIAPGERYLKLLNQILQKNPNISQKVLDGLLSFLKVRRTCATEVKCIEDIFVTIAQKKPKFIQQIVPIVNALWKCGYRFSREKLGILASNNSSYHAVDELEEKKRLIKEKLAESNATKSEDDKLIMGKTASTDGKVEDKHKQTAELQIDAVKNWRAKRQKNE